MEKTEEKHVAEWLHERSQLLRTLGEFSCKDFMTYEFGISSPCTHPRTCRDCYADMFERIADRIDREMMEKERMKKENAELKAELSDWKGNAEGFQPDAYMKLPLDADGEPIRIGDEVNIDGDAMTDGGVMTVLGYRLYDDEILLVANDENGLIFARKPSRVRHFGQAPADSWEKLEKDARKTACDYAPAPCDEDGLTTCYGCPFQKSESCSNEMAIDLVERAKKLAGIEEEARND